MPFDLRTDHRNAKTGKVTHRTPYRLLIKDGTQLFERPPGSCQMYNPDGSLNQEASELALHDSKRKAEEAAKKVAAAKAARTAEQNRIREELAKMEAEEKEREAQEKLAQEKLARQNVAADRVAAAKAAALDKVELAGKLAQPSKGD